MRAYALAFPFAAALVACGSSVETNTGGTTNTGAGGGTTTTTTGTGGTATGGCPATDPIGLGCTPAQEGLRCTYGDSVRPECRNDFTCTNGGWVTTKGFCQPALDCGPTAPAQGSPCAGAGVCVVGNEICVCGSCWGGPCSIDQTWGCAPPPTTPGCPPTVPNDGTACTQAGLSCSYGLACAGSGALVDCKDGRWTWSQAIACPE